MKKIIVIPARLESKRLPNKVLLDLGGKTILQRVFEQCLLSDATQVFIATDSEEVKEACLKFTKNVIITSSSHTSGTDRIAEAVKNINCDVVINVQGDEPFISPNLINQLLEAFENDNIIMVSAMERIYKVDELKMPNVVKVVVDKNHDALYFSRSIIPFIRDNMVTEEILKEQCFYRHVGVYGYKKSFLQQYTSMSSSFLESTEKLEQLRVLENGYKIKMIETNYNSLGIDTLDDYSNAQQQFLRKK